jgi:hypothetical protein
MGMENDKRQELIFGFATSSDLLQSRAYELATIHHGRRCGAGRQTGH